MEPVTEISETASEKRSWSGFWSGLIWVIIGTVIILGSQFFALFCVIVWEAIRSGADEISDDRMMTIMNSGDVLSLSFLIALPLIAAMLAFAVMVRRKSSFLAYLGIRLVEKRTWLIWVLAAFGLLIANSLSDWIFDRPPVPDVMVTIYQNTEYPWLLFITIALLAPLLEELLYRGYVIRVWSESVIGPVAGTVLVSLIWAATHQQYDLYNMVWVFLLGVLLCLSRLRTQSIIPSYSIHVGWNSIGFAAMAFYGTA